MAVSPDRFNLDPFDSEQTQLKRESHRRSRYVRDTTVACTLTPPRLSLLRSVAEYGLLSLPQIVRLSGRSEKSVQRGLRPLFDAGLVAIVPVSRAALAAPGEANDATLLFGSAPNVYVSTRAGARLLHREGLIDNVRSVPQYGPQNALFLRHELALRDVRIWLELAARGQPGHTLMHWKDGADAAIDLKRTHPPRWVRPDTWCVYKAGDRLLVGLVEYDRGTERGETRWREKLAAYGVLFAGPRLQEVTGYVNARVLVICATESGRDRLARLIHTYALEALAARFWLTTRATLDQPTLTHRAWRIPNRHLLLPLVPDSDAVGTAT